MPVWVGRKIHGRYQVSTSRKVLSWSTWEPPSLILVCCRAPAAIRETLPSLQGWLQVFSSPLFLPGSPCPSASPYYWLMSMELFLSRYAGALNSVPMILVSHSSIQSHSSFATLWCIAECDIHQIFYSNIQIYLYVKGYGQILEWISLSSLKWIVGVATRHWFQEIPKEIDTLPVPPSTILQTACTVAYMPNCLHIQPTNCLHSGIYAYMYYILYFMALWALEKKLKDPP